MLQKKETVINGDTYFLHLDTVEHKRKHTNIQKIEKSPKERILKEWYKQEATFNRYYVENYQEMLEKVIIAWAKDEGEKINYTDIFVHMGEFVGWDEGHDNNGTAEKTTIIKLTYGAAGGSHMQPFARSRVPDKDLDKIIDASNADNSNDDELSKDTGKVKKNTKRSEKYNYKKKRDIAKYNFDKTGKALRSSMPFGLLGLIFFGLIIGISKLLTPEQEGQNIPVGNSQAIDDEEIEELLESLCVDKDEKKEIKKNIDKNYNPSSTITQNSFNTPEDHSCLFWAIALSTLLPLSKNDDPTKFNEMYDKLFFKAPSVINQYLVDKNEIRQFLANYKPAFDVKEIKDHPVLSYLVRVVFRRNVVDYIDKEISEDKRNIYIENYDGDFERYAKAMRSTKKWGGYLEVIAASQMLGINIEVENGSGNHPHGATQTIQIVHIGERHYHYRLTPSLHYETLPSSSSSSASTDEISEAKYTVKKEKKKDKQQKRKKKHTLEERQKGDTSKRDPDGEGGAPSSDSKSQSGSNQGGSNSSSDSGKPDQAQADQTSEDQHKGDRREKSAPITFPSSADSNLADVRSNPVVTEELLRFSFLNEKRRKNQYEGSLHNVLQDAPDSSTTLLEPKDDFLHEEQAKSVSCVAKI